MNMFSESLSRNSDETVAVATLQVAILAILGRNSLVSLSCIFDEHMEAAVKKLQRQFWIEPNGCFDGDLSWDIWMEIGLNMNVLYEVVKDQLEKKPDGTFWLKNREAFREVPDLNVGALDKIFRQPREIVPDVNPPEGPEKQCVLIWS